MALEEKQASHTTAASDIVLLGPQRMERTVDSVLRSLELEPGPVCAITAGWQEREGEVDELSEHVHRDVIDLRLYRRAERVFHDSAFDQLRRQHRERQRQLRELQRLYRIRLYYALESLRHLARLQGESRMLQSERQAAMAGVRLLDRQHLRALRRVHSEFPGLLVNGPEIDQVREIIQRSRAVLIAGGHVAVLLNRMRLFGLEGLLASKPVVAWSAGAMAISERIVLFHDSPPQGQGDAEVLETGLGLVKGIVPLPHASDRLRLADRRRTSRLARRFLPLHCLTLDPGSLLHFRAGELCDCRACRRLKRSGRLADLELK